MAQFILIIREDLTRYPITDEKLNALIKAHSDWAKKLSSRGIFESGNGIGPEGVLIEKRDGKLQTVALRDTKEGVGGYYIINAENMEQAIAIGKECPTFDEGDIIEVRPVMG